MYTIIFALINYLCITLYKRYYSEGFGQYFGSHVRSQLIKVLLSITPVIINQIVLNEDIYHLHILNLITIILTMCLLISIEKTLTDNIILIMALSGAIYNYFFNLGLISLLVFAAVNLVLVYLINYTSNFFRDKLLLKNYDVKLFVVCGFYLIPENFAFFYICMSFFMMLTILCYRIRNSHAEFISAHAMIISLYFCCLFSTKLDFAQLTLM